MRRHHTEGLALEVGALTGRMCHINVTPMKKTTIRELKHETSKVLLWVAQGETVEVLRRNVPVAVLSPAASRAQGKRPDFAARLREVYGEEILPTTGTDLVSSSRGES